MQKPGAPPQENADSDISAEGARFPGRNQASLHARSLPSPFAMSRFQRFETEGTDPGALPQAVTFRALGAF